MEKDPVELQFGVLSAGQEKLDAQIKGQSQVVGDVERRIGLIEQSMETQIDRIDALDRDLDNLKTWRATAEGRQGGMGDLVTRIFAAIAALGAIVTVIEKVFHH